MLAWISPRQRRSCPAGDQRSPNLIDRPPWHAIAVKEVRETTGLNTWALAKARMEGGGLPVFSAGTFKGNRSYYLAGPIQWPDRPLWETCRAFLSDRGLIQTTASREETWEAVAYWEGLGLWLHEHHPRQPILDQVRSWYWGEA